MKLLIPWFLSLVLAVWCIALLIKVQKLTSATTGEVAGSGGTSAAPALAPAEPKTEREEAAPAEENELLRLRNEVSQLRQSKKELEATTNLQAHQLSAAIASRQNAEAYARQRAEAPSEEVVLKPGMIGAMFSLSTNNTPVVRAVSENSPAGRAGIKPGDVVVSVNGTNAFSMTFAELMQAIRGDEGTPVILEVDDGTAGGRRQVTLIRERVDLNEFKVPAGGSVPNP